MIQLLEDFPIPMASRVPKASLKKIGFPLLTEGKGPITPSEEGDFIIWEQPRKKPFLSPSPEVR